MKILVILLILIFIRIDAAGQSKPNIVVIMADDLGYSDIGCFGGEIKTPNLDKLAANGLRLTQLYNSARCCPTRASLITGLQPHQVGVGHMAPTRVSKAHIGYAGFRNDNNITIPEALKSAGYFTAMAGKWHIAPGLPTERGFQEFYGLVGGFASFWNPNKYKRLPEDSRERNYDPGQFYATDAITDYALDFIDEAQAKAKPLFLYLAYNAPHFPLQAPKEEADKYFDYYKKGWDHVRKERFNRMKEMGFIQKNTKLSSRGAVPESQIIDSAYNIPAWTAIAKDQQMDLARRMAIYAGMVDRMDQNIGRVLDKLEQEDQLDNTLIIFLSDNGGCAEWTENGFDKRSGAYYKVHTAEELDEMGLSGTYHHYGSGWANVSNTPFRSYKHYAYEGGISSPTILHWPNMINSPGKIDRRPGHITDIMATCIEAAGAAYPQEFEGRKILPMEGESLFPVMKGNSVAERVICIEHEGNKMVRQGKWKIVTANYKDNVWELFNIEEDRTEQFDLSEKYPKKLKAIMKLYEAWALRSQVEPWEEIAPFD